MSAGGRKNRSTNAIVLVLITAGTALPACDKSKDPYRQGSSYTVSSGTPPTTQGSGSPVYGSGGYWSHGVWVNTNGGNTWGRSGVASGSSSNVTSGSESESSSHVGAASEGHGSSFGGFGAHGAGHGGGGE